MSSRPAQPALGVAGWSWVEHLRSGGSTPWQEWRMTEHAPVEPRWATPPSAAQLDVVRLLAGSARKPRSGGFDTLADLVLTTPVGGRGRIDPALPRDDGPLVELSPRELLRVCVAAIAGWCRDNPLPEERPRRSPRHWPWQRSFVVSGLSPHAEAVRSALLAAGHAEGGRNPVVLVVGGPVEAMLGAHWRRRALAGAGVRWQRLWTVMALRGRLPGAVDLAGLANRWTECRDAGRVEIVLADDPADCVDTVGQILQLDLDRHTPAAQDPVDTDLLRRLNQVLPSKEPGARRRLLAGELVPLLSRPYQRLAAPAAQLGWAVDRAEALATRLTDGPWVVHGDPRVVVPSTDAGVSRSVPAGQTLDLALQVLLALEGGDRWPRR